MSADDVIVEIARMTGLSANDIEGLKACSPQDLAALMEGYIAMGKVSDRGTWVLIGEKLKQAEPYLSVAVMILAVCSGVWGLAHA